MRNRRTEIDHLNGYVSRRGREHGVLTPINDAVIAETHVTASASPRVRSTSTRSRSCSP